MPAPYSIVYADPPWSYRDTRGADRGIKQGGALSHYPVMSRESIKALPVQRICAPDAWLFLWATWPCLPEAMEVMEAWGFRYITAAFVWVKTYDGEVATNSNTAMGMGSYSRSNTECVLLGRSGRIRRASTGVRQVIIAPRTRHSAKPPEVRHRIVDLCGDLPRVELFARMDGHPSEAGWDQWGNEVAADRHGNLSDDPMMWGDDAGNRLVHGEHTPSDGCGCSAGGG